MSPPTSALRLGVIGCGNVLGAYRPVIERLRARGEAMVTLACGRAAQRDTALSILEAPRFTTRAEELINCPEVDGVIILTSMPSHASLASAALKAGKHVLVEKPLATNLPEAQALVELTLSSPGHLVCAPFTILSPTFQAISRHILAGDIGRPCSARARYGWAGPDWSEWFYKSGGGCLFDLGVYCLTSLTGLLGPVKRVMAMTGVAVSEREVNGHPVRVEAEDNAQVLLDFGESNFGVVTSGFTLQQYRSPALEVYGTSGTIQMLGDDWDPDGYELFQNRAGCWQVFKETIPEWSWTDGLNHLVDCARNGRKPLVTAEQALHVLEVMLKAQQSGREGRGFEIETTFNLPRFANSALGEPVHRQHDRSREH
jgi:predicted dehydrogenase